MRCTVHGSHHSSMQPPPSPKVNHFYRRLADSLSESLSCIALARNVDQPTLSWKSVYEFALPLRL